MPHIKTCILYIKTAYEKEEKVLAFWVEFSYFVSEDLKIREELI